MSSNQESMLWKVEPLSPSGTPPRDSDEEWLSFDEKPADLEGFGQQPELYEEQLTRAQVATKYLEELELKNWIKEESFADWLEEKIELPIFEEIPAPECGQNRAVVYPDLPKVQQQQQHHAVAASQVDATQSLLREFETVLGDVEACHQINAVVPGQIISTLTPPQSPPPLSKQHLILANQQNAHLLVSLQPLHHSQVATFVYEQQHQQHHEEPAMATSSQQHPESYAVSALNMSEAAIEHQLTSQWSAENLSLEPLVHSNDVAQELAKVDELVIRAADAVGDAGSSCSPVSPASPCTSSNASCISSEDSSDPDWCFESAAPSSSSGRRVSQARSQSRRASKPYSRPTVEDKRVRKKEQNKNAATRYRQKKKQEIKEILNEEQELLIKNEKLQEQLKDVQREISTLKGLVRYIAEAKGLIK